MREVEKEPGQKPLCAKGGRPAPAPRPPPARPMKRCFPGKFPAVVTITLPGGTQPSFALALEDSGAGFARAGVIKDAGDDPDVTHGVLVIARVSDGPPGSGVTFRAGEGIGTVTRAGLPLPPGEPAINPVPRRMIKAAIEEIARLYDATGDVIVEISIPGGEAIAKRTLNARLGIVGGLSILGTSGIVVPYSCAAWIENHLSRHRCRASERRRSCRGFDGFGFGSRRQGVARIAGHRADRDG